MGLAISAVMLERSGAFSGGQSKAALLGCLSDAFFVPGALLLGVGALIYVSGEGVFDLLGYGTKRIFFRGRETFAQYQQSKAKKGKRSPVFLLRVGVGFFLAAGVFLGLYFVFSA